jgi:hypothetical protein
MGYPNFWNKNQQEKYFSDLNYFQKLTSYKTSK